MKIRFNDVLVNKSRAVYLKRPERADKWNVTVFGKSAEQIKSDKMQALI